MSFIETIPASQVAGAARDMYERQQEHWGYVPNYAKDFSHRPEVMAHWARLLAELRRPVSDYRFELVTFAAARTLKHSACSLAHGRLLAEMIGTESVVAIATGREAEVLSACDAAIVEFARAIALDATTTTSGQVDALKKLHRLSDADIFDIAAIAAGRCFFSKLLDALGSEPDVSFMSIDAQFRQLLTIGRPICQRKAEHVEPLCKTTI